MLAEQLGLGGYPTVSLAQAIDYAREALQQIRSGTDPAAQRRAKRLTVEWTFERTAHAYIEAHRPSWKNDKHAAQWESTLKAYAYPVFGNKHVRDLSKADVLAAIEPIWSTKNETASRVRNRIELVLSYAIQRELRPEGLQPPVWGGCLVATTANTTLPRCVGWWSGTPSGATPSTKSSRACNCSLRLPSTVNPHAQKSVGLHLFRFAGPLLYLCCGQGLKSP